MAIVSVGYDGTVDEVAIANMFPNVGAAHYGVVGPSDWKVSAHPSTAQAVNIAAGAGWGHFVYDVSDAISTVQCDPIVSGTRWDMITVKRDWQPVNGTTVFSKVTGGATLALPTRLNTPGVQDEQPLAMVKWTSGQTQPTSIIDIRCWAANGGMAARDELCKGYLNQLGTEVYIDGVKWLYVPGLNDVPEWVVQGGSTGTSSPVAATNWSTTGAVSVTSEGDKTRVTVDLTFKRTGPDTSLTNSALVPLSTPIPVSARGTGATKYVPAWLVGGGNNIMIGATLNTSTGLVNVEAIADPITIKTNAQFSLNLSYYIT